MTRRACRFDFEVNATRSDKSRDIPREDAEGLRRYVDP
jgi:hypothetical protein